jgi:ATP-binding cassette, subfamily B, bacterial
MDFVGAEASARELRLIGSRLCRQSLIQMRGRAAAFVVVNLVGVAVSLLMPIAVGRAIDAAISGRGLPAALVLLGVLLAVSTVDAALDDLLGSYMGAAMTARLRHRLLRQFLALGLAERQPFPPGDVLSRLAVNADSPGMFLPVLISAGTTALVGLGGLAGLTLIDWRLAAAFLIGVPIAVAFIRMFIAQATEPFVRYQQIQASIVGRLLDAFRGARTIRASGTAEREIERVLEPLPELHEVGRRVWLLQGQASWRLTLLTPLLQVLVLGVGGYILAAGGITPGELVAAASYVALAIGASSLADALFSLLGCEIGAGRVGEVLEAEPPVSAPAMPLRLPEGPGEIEFHGVTVRLEGETVLAGLDLTVPAGTDVAVVGRSGTGKSTLVSLVGRLLDPDEGVVLLDGVPIRRLALPALRRAVTYAFERPALLGATVHDTIAYGRPDATRDDVVAAAQAARADGFVRMLPDGYDTTLARAPMSGGELQRLGLARAILSRARVMVLDDATSSLDTATEVEVIDALARVLAGRTSLVVAYRAATAARADLVAWLDGGRIRALAPHRVLWADPAYRALFAAGDVEPADAVVSASASASVPVPVPDRVGASR